MSVRFFKLLAVAIFICVAAGIVHFQFHKSKTTGVFSPAKNSVPVSTKKDFPRAIDSISDKDLPNIAASPEIALAVGLKFLADDPSDESGRAANFLAALCNAGQFQTALEFSEDAPPDFRDNWLKLIFTRWTQSNPQTAIAALDSIQDPSARTQAFQTAADTWAASNPSALADYVASMPAGDSQAYAFRQVAGNWSLQDPAAFAAWLNTSPPGVDLDQAIAEMISRTDGANRAPEVAMEWVESIDDPALKQDSLMRVLGEWNQTDSAAAQNYVLNAPWLDDRQRQDILSKLQTPPPSLATKDDE
jgi:hypothetical protein